MLLNFFPSTYGLFLGLTLEALSCSPSKGFQEKPEMICWAGKSV